MSARILERVRKLCLALPAAHEVEAWGEPTFRIQGGKIFAMYAAANNHHGGGRPGVWIKAAPGNQPLMLRAAPDRFFVPPYVGPSGWIGVWLDGRDAPVDWEELAELLADGHRLVMPKRMLAALAKEGTKPAVKKAASTKAAAKKKPSSKRATPKKTSAPKKKAASKRRRA